MTMTSAGSIASDAILRHREELAHAVTDALYVRRPELMDRWGEAGRAKCLQDMRYNLEHLAPAVALDDPALFAGYVRWLRDMLGARGIPTDDVRSSLELMREAIDARLPHDQAASAVACIAAGLATLAQHAAD